jgi:hypothetical protein
VRTQRIIFQFQKENLLGLDECKDPERAKTNVKINKQIKISWDKLFM